MELHEIVVKSKILLFQNLNDDDVKTFIEKDRVKGIVKKYPFNIFYSVSSPDNYPGKSLSEIYDYALINFEIFFNNFEHEYTKDDVQNFALLFALNNYHFSGEAIQEHVALLEDNFVEHESNAEIINWCQESIKMFKIYIYSYDVKNYRNGIISKLLEELENIAHNHKVNLIYEIENNQVDE